MTSNTTAKIAPMPAPRSEFGDRSCMTIPKQQPNMA
jgi:hypothetical protein